MEAVHFGSGAVARRLGTALGTAGVCLRPGVEYTHHELAPR